MPDTKPAKPPPVDGEGTVLRVSAALTGIVLLFLLWRLIVGWSGVVSFFEYVADRPDEVLTRTWEHIQLTFYAVATATAISVPLGVAVMRNAALRNIALAIAGVLLTIPSLAFFAILIPLVGIGFFPPYISLVAYAILPILRNTVTGLASVDPAVIESAKGMGLNRMKQITRVELPLAWPVILTGIQVASILTISIAAIAVLVGWGGLGAFIQNGLTRFGFPGATESIWLGTLLTVILALVFEGLFLLLNRVTTSKGLQ